MWKKLEFNDVPQTWKTALMLQQAGACEQVSNVEFYLAVFLEPGKFFPFDSILPFAQRLFKADFVPDDGVSGVSFKGSRERHRGQLRDQAEPI